MENLEIAFAQLAWHLAIGVDCAIDEVPTDWLAAPVRPAPAPHATDLDKRQKNEIHRPEATAKAPPVHTPPIHAIQKAESLAAQATSLASLRAALEEFTLCPLRNTAHHLVFGDGTSPAPVMVIGDAPDNDEDSSGIAYSGAAGTLLDKMLAAIGINRRENCFIGHAVFWRPPGNRTPTENEIALCRPFILRQIALLQPALIIVLGSLASRALLQTDDPVARLRGKFHDLQIPTPQGNLAIPLRASFSPALLRTAPLQKKLAWEDLLAVKDKLRSLGVL